MIGNSTASAGISAVIQSGASAMLLSVLVADGKYRSRESSVIVWCVRMYISAELCPLGCGIVVISGGHTSRPGNTGFIRR